MSDDYNPQSVDAMLSRILQRMDAQDELAVKILDQVTLTNGRVTVLERIWAILKAQVVAVSAAVSCIIGAVVWAIQTLL